MKKNDNALHFIKHLEDYYLDKLDYKIDDQHKLSQPISPADIVFYKIEKITYEEKDHMKTALENVLSAMRIIGVNF